MNLPGFSGRNVSIWGKEQLSKAGNLGIKEGGHGRVEATNSIISLAPSVFRTQSNMYNGAFMQK